MFLSIIMALHLKSLYPGQWRQLQWKWVGFSSIRNIAVTDRFASAAVSSWDNNILPISPGRLRTHIHYSCTFISAWTTMSHKRQRTRSRASSAGHETGTNASATSSPAPSSPVPSRPTDKKSKFERQFDAANQSDKDVLGTFIGIKTHAHTDGHRSAKRNRWSRGGLRCTSISVRLSFFTMTLMEFPTSSIVNSRSKLLYFMICAKCYLRNPSVTVMRARHNDSTSNLVHHVRDCDKTAPPESGSIMALRSRIHLHAPQAANEDSSLDSPPQPTVYSARRPFSATQKFKPNFCYCPTTVPLLKV